MNKKMLLLLFTVIVGPLNGLANFRAIEAFTVIDHDQFTFEAEKLVPNMPLVQSQDTLGICFAFSAGACAQQYYCQQEKIDCKKITPEQKISPFQMAAFTADGNPKYEVNNVFRYDSIPEAGNTAVALNVGTSLAQMGYADSCFPWDKFVSDHGDDEKIIGDLFKKLQDAYHSKLKDTEGSVCTECVNDTLATLNKGFGIKVDNVKLLKAVTAESYAHFLFSLFFNSNPSGNACDDVIDFGEAAIVDLYPPKENTVGDYDGAMKIIKDVIQTGSPVNLNGICMEKKKDGTCVCVETENGSCVEARHTVAIAGYRKACRKTPECKNQCNKSGCYVESLKVHNSWGQSWQNQFDDGWVDARTLLNNTRLNAGALSWVHKKEKL